MSLRELERADTRRLLYSAIVAFGAALVMAGASARKVEPMQADAPNYLAGARSLIDSGSYQGISGHAQTTFPPGYSLLIAGAYRLAGDFETAARSVSALASAGSVVLVLVLTHALAGWPAALVATSACLGLPLRAESATVIYSEHVFAFLVLAAATVSLRIQGSVPLHDSMRAGLVGILLGAAYLTRPEAGLAVLCVAGLLVYRVRPWTAGIRSLAVFGLLFALTASPYMVFLHSATGRWTTSTKLRGNLAVAPAKSAGVSWVELRQLNPEATGYWTPDVVVSPLDLLKRYASNSEKEACELAEALSPLALLLIGVGLFGQMNAGSDPRALFLLALTALPLLLYPLFFVKQRFLISVLPFCCVWIGVGVHEAWRRGGERIMPRLVATALVCAIAASYGWHDLSMLRAPDAERWEKQMGLWMRRNGMSGERLISKHYAVDFFARTRHVAIPYAEFPELLRFAKHRQARYLLLNESDQVPQSVRSLAAGTQYPRAKLHLIRHQLEADGDNIALYEIKRR